MAVLHAVDPGWWELCHLQCVASAVTLITSIVSITASGEDAEWWAVPGFTARPPKWCIIALPMCRRLELGLNCRVGWEMQSGCVPSKNRKAVDS